MADATLTNPPDRSPDDLDPSALTIEHYSVERELAHGGLGRILVARDRRLGRRVALKVPIDSAVEGPRFAHEVRITSKLQHPSIVPLYEAGRLPSGEPFFAMKLVGGKTLSAAIAEARTPAERLALLPNVIAVADAIAYAHDQNIVHRDVKPSNVVLGAFGESVLLDWGVARELGRDDKGEGIVGTPAYMAPEQAAGAPTDPRFDVYALGAVLRQVLCGEAPYRGADSDEVLRLLAEAPPTPLEQHWPEVPPELATIVQKAMAREPSHRYPSARELAADLRRFQTGQLVGAHAYSTWALVRRWLARHRLTVAVALLLGVSLAAQAVVSVRRISTARAEAEGQRDALTLAQARSSLHKDPTAALAWLQRYPAGASDWSTARSLAADALDSGAALHSFRHISAARVSPDGNVFVLHGTPMIRLWQDGKSRVLDVREKSLSALDLSADGKTLVTFGREGAVRLWPIAGGPDRLLWNANEDGAIGGEAHWSPDGKRIAVAAGKNQVWLFSVEGGPPRRFEAGSFIHDLTFSPDSAWLAAATVGRVAHLWHLDGPGDRVLSGHTEDVRTVAFSPDGAALATGSHDGTVRIWELAGPVSRELRGHSGQVLSVHWFPDGRLVSGGLDGTVRIWDRTGAGRVLGRHASGGVITVDVNGARVASSGEDQTVRVWDLATQESWVFRGHDGPVLRVQLFDGGRRALSWGYDEVARVWEMKPRAGHLLQETEGNMIGVAWAPDSSWVAIGSWDKKVRLCAVGGSCRVLGEHRAPVMQVRVSPDGRTIASGSGDGEVRVWDPAGGAPRVLSGAKGAAKRLAFSPDGRELAGGGEDRSVWLWDVTSGQGREIYAQNDGVSWVGFRPDGAGVGSTGFDGTACLWTRDGHVSVLRGHTEWVMAGAFSPDSRYLATASWDTTVRLWPVNGGEPRIVGRHEKAVMTVAFSPDGRWLATGSNDKTARLWNLSSGESRVLRGHETNLRPIGFDPSGARLATAGDDGTIRIWDSSTGESRVLRGHQGLINTMGWSPDGRFLVSSSADKSAWIWEPSRLAPLPRDPAAARSLFARSTSVVLSSEDDQPETP